jgi:hypothetical protein
LGNPDKKPVPVSVVSVRGVTGKAAVYNLTVEDAHEFFANGVLVHNCDALSGAFTLAMELGDGPAAQAQVVSREQMTQILG